jgi:thymidylate synthase ThyX
MVETRVQERHYAWNTSENLKKWKKSYQRKYETSPKCFANTNSNYRSMALSTWKLR